MHKKDIQENINELFALLNDETNEQHLLEHGGTLIESLRTTWKEQKQEFSKDNIKLLQKASSQLNAIAEFIVEQDDFKYIDTVDDADEIIGRLYDLMEITGELAVSGRIQKEISELVERKAELPSRSKKQHDIELRNAIIKLDAKAPNCKRKGCGNKMVIRQADGSYFWGCSSFPKCWGRQWLSKEELELLLSD